MRGIGRPRQGMGIRFLLSSASKLMNSLTILIPKNSRNGRFGMEKMGKSCCRRDT
jgi:hypothetical protein